MTAMSLNGIGAGEWWLLAALLGAAFRLGWMVGARRVFGLGRASPMAPLLADAPDPAAKPIDAPRAASPAGALDETLRPTRARLGRYRIERELGRGSMGTVYLGHDPETGRAVAIKTMALGREFDGIALAEARARFFREAEVARRLHHPDIVTTFEAVEDQGLAFIAMEFIHGHDLSSHTLPANLLPVPTVLRTLARVALALAHAHREGVVHRDVKPANVMVDLTSGTVKVTDFGIARVADGCSTRTGLVLGTPSFMSPEQMAGRRVDGRSDLYSLGVVLFQLLTGAPPHRSESMADLMNRIVNETAPDVRSVRPELTEALANVVALALEKRVEVRYADGGQMAEDLLAVATLIDAEAALPPASPPTLQPAPHGVLGRVTEGRQTPGFGVAPESRPGDPRHNASH